MIKLNRLFYEPVGNQPLAVFRIITGIWFFADYVIQIVTGWLQDHFIDPPFHFTFIGFGWVTPLPSWAMHAIVVGLLVASLGIIFGYRYRLSSIVFLVGHLYIFFIDIVYGYNKSYLFILLALVLVCVPAHSCWSMDVKRNPAIKKEAVPRWNILILQLLVAIIYTYSGISKLTSDWLEHRQPLSHFLSNSFAYEHLDPSIRSVVVSIYTYGGVLFDLSIIWLLTRKRTNFFANILQALFHTVNLITLGIGTLSIYMIFVTWLLFPTSWLKRKLNYNTDNLDRNTILPHKQWTTVLLCAFIVIQVLVPHRHYLTGNNVNWTEKGHRFSWRLMTRTKSGSRATFTIIDKATGERWRINPQDYLTSRQYFKMAAETDLVLCFVDYLEVLWAEKGYNDIEIYSNIMTRLNRRKPQHLIPPNLDLTTVERTFIRDEVSTKVAPIF